MSEKRIQWSEPKVERLDVGETLTGPFTLTTEQFDLRTDVPVSTS